MAYHDITDINFNHAQYRPLQRKLHHHQNQLFERYSMNRHG